jgi:hypothetical protein
LKIRPDRGGASRARYSVRGPEELNASGSVTVIEEYALHAGQGCRGRGADEIGACVPPWLFKLCRMDELRAWCTWIGGRDHASYLDFGRTWGGSRLTK